MARKYLYCMVAIVAALTVSALSGCGNQPASQADSTSQDASAETSAPASSSDASSESATEQEAAEKSQDEILAELKASLASVPAYTSVTATEKSLTWVNSGAEADAAGDDSSVEATSTFKFDESGSTIKTFAEYTMEDIVLQYYTDGDDAVCVTDGPVYSGTVEQFALSHAAGSDAYLKETIGDLDTIVDCATSVSQDVIDGITGYELILDAEKYIESDEMLKLMADSGDPVQDAYITVGFDNSGRIAWMTKTDVFTQLTKSTLLDLTDYDSTTIDPMPEATNTYEEMEEDIKAKQDELAEEL